MIEGYSPWGDIQEIRKSAEERAKQHETPTSDEMSVAFLASFFGAMVAMIAGALLSEYVSTKTATWVVMSAYILGNVYVFFRMLMNGRRGEG